MITIREISGDTIIGDVDGVNRDYSCTFYFADQSAVFVYVNDVLRNPEDLDGYTFVDFRTIRMKSALIGGDVLRVEYDISYPGRGGGADGGIPDAPEIIEDFFYVETSENIPTPIPEEIEPIIYPDEIEAGIFTDDIRPVIISSREE